MSSIIDEREVLKALAKQEDSCSYTHKISPSELVVDNTSANFVGKKFNKIQMPPRHPQKRLPMYVPK